MLITIDKVKKIHNIINVIHIGAHLAEEAESYYKNGVNHSLWIEGNSELMNQLNINISKYKNANAINALLSNVDNEFVSFNISNNGMSSSILEMADHKIAHPEVIVIETRNEKTTTLNSIFNKYKIPFDLYDFMNIDIQGAELMMLEGATEVLPFIKCIYLEVNFKELYVGCPMIEKIDKFLSEMHFIRIKTVWYGDTGWGDSIYINKQKTKIHFLNYSIYNFLDSLKNKMTICKSYLKTHIRQFLSHRQSL
jgi:FkbM family methyltransferase